MERREKRVGRLRPGSRCLLALLLAGTAALGGWPGTVLGAGPKKPVLQPVTSRPPASAPAPNATVDHPPVDGVTSFDNGPRSSGRIALTFDADMTPAMLAQLRSGQVRSWYNQDVRDLLDRERVPATIFLTGLWAATYPEVARSLARDSLFEIGSHTHDHAAFRTPCYGLAPARDRSAEIAVAQQEIADTTGIRPELLRFPGDCYAAADVALASSFGLTVVSGDVRGGDGFNLSATAIASTVLRAVRPGSIVVLHIHGGPNAPMTAPALRMIIDGVRARGLGFGTASQVLGRLTASPAVAGRGGALEPLRSLALALPARPLIDGLRAHALRRPLRVLGRLEEHLLP